MKNKNTKPQTNGKLLNDIYCRGCHARPSYAHGTSFLCSECIDRRKRLWKSAQELDDSEVEAFKGELTAFIKSKGRYVWFPEVFLYLRPLRNKEFKRHGIKIPTICRELGFFAPPDDRLTIETVARVTDFASEYVAINGKTPNVREVLAAVGVDHANLWSCMNYDKFVVSLGGRSRGDLRYRFPSDDAFRQAAAEIVKKPGCPLHMTVILDELGVSYPAYLENFKSVTPEEIHILAGVSRDLDGMASLFEVAGRLALNQLGWEVEPQVSFPDLVSKNNRLLHFDFRLSGTTILVEIDGDQHYYDKVMYFKPSNVENDKLKDDYVKLHGYQLIRVDTRTHKSPWAMKEYLQSHIGSNPRGPINPSNALNTTGPARREIKRGETRDRPRAR